MRHRRRRLRRTRKQAAKRAAFHAFTIATFRKHYVTESAAMVPSFASLARALGVVDGPRFPVVVRLPGGREYRS